MKHFLKRTFDFFSSFGLAVTLIILMFVLTLLGTLEQVEHGLYEVQKRYFESAFVVYDLYGVPIPLPGGATVLILFTINLICGGIVRMKKNWRTPGVLIGHLGILLLLAGGFVTWQFSEAGAMSLYEMEESNEFSSYHDWNIEIAKVGGDENILVIEDKQFKDVGPGESRTFYSDALPFDVIVSDYARNTLPMQARSEGGNVRNVVDGYVLQRMPVNPTAEQNAPGAYVTIRDKESGEEQQIIAWGLSTEPAAIDVAGEQWTVDMFRKRWQVPFTVRLDDFQHEFHPGTSMAASFDSHITKTIGDTQEKFHIYMNHPLRHEGYTFFQSGWGPPDARPGERLYSTFSVVRNPADHWPLYACIIISFGMVVHFTQKLARYIRRETRRQPA